MIVRCENCNEEADTVTEDDVYICNRCLRAIAAATERDRLQAVLLARHGGEPLALLDELDEARAERDRLREWAREALDFIDGAEPYVRMYALDCVRNRMEPLLSTYPPEADEEV